MADGKSLEKLKIEIKLFLVKFTILLERPDILLGMGISFRPLQKDVVSSIARVFDRTARHVFERCVSKLLSPIDGIRSKRNKE